MRTHSLSLLSGRNVPQIVDRVEMRSGWVAPVKPGYLRERLEEEQKHDPGTVLAVSPSSGYHEYCLRGVIMVLRAGYASRRKGRVAG